MNTSSQSRATPICGTLFERVDLSAERDHKGTRIHDILQLHINEPEISAVIFVIDLDNVQITQAAKAVLSRCHMPVALVLVKYGEHCQNNLVRRGARGAARGQLVLNTAANYARVDLTDETFVNILGQVRMDGSNAIREVKIFADHDTVSLVEA